MEYDSKELYKKNRVKRSVIPWEDLVLFVKILSLLIAQIKGICLLTYYIAQIILILSSCDLQMFIYSQRHDREYSKFSTE